MLHPMRLTWDNFITLQQFVHNKSNGISTYTKIAQWNDHAGPEFPLFYSHFNQRFHYITSSLRPPNIRSTSTCRTVITSWCRHLVLASRPILATDQQEITLVFKYSLFRHHSISCVRSSTSSFLFFGYPSAQLVRVTIKFTKGSVLENWVIASSFSELLQKLCLF